MSSSHTGYSFMFRMIYSESLLHNTHTVKGPDGKLDEWHTEKFMSCTATCSTSLGQRAGNLLFKSLRRCWGEAVSTSFRLPFLCSSSKWETTLTACLSYQSVTEVEVIATRVPLTLYHLISCCRQTGLNEHRTRQRRVVLMAEPPAF